MPIPFIDYSKCLKHPDPRLPVWLKIKKKPKKKKDQNDIKTEDEDDENDEDETIEDIRRKNRRQFLRLNCKSRKKIVDVDNDVIIESPKSTSKSVSKSRKQRVSPPVFDDDDVIIESSETASTSASKSKKQCY